MLSGYNLENTRFYINKHYEKEIDSVNVTRHYHYIYGDNGVVALHIANGNTGADSMYYIHTDHLGSYCAITSPSKKLAQRNYFDPWGNMPKIFYGHYQRGDTIFVNEPYSNGDSLVSSDAPTLNFSLTHRGFTGHEHYPYFKIINMNGRLYDPVIGRFFSPDKYVANSSFTQDYNRYTYARNNPLMYTDPSGDHPLVIAFIIGAVMAATSYTVTAAVAPGGLSQNWNLGQFALNTLFGGVVGGMSAGIGMALTPALTAAGIGGCWSGAISGAVTGTFSGTMSGLMQYSMTGDANAIWRSALIGMGTGALIGGISSGIEAKMDGRTFWNGNRITRTTFVKQNIAPVLADGDMDCVGSNIESISNGKYTQKAVRIYMKGLGSNKNTQGLSTYETTKWYADKIGVSFKHVNLETNPLSAEQYATIMNQGNGSNAIISLGEGRLPGHTVTLESIMSETITKVNGKVIDNIIYTVMDPAVGGFVSYYNGIPLSRAVYFIGIP